MSLTRPSGSITGRLSVEIMLNVKVHPARGTVSLFPLSHVSYRWRDVALGAPKL